MTASNNLLDRLNHVTPKDGDEMTRVYQERGWIEALQYLSRKGMLTAAEKAEAAKIVAASNEWVDGLNSDALVLPPVPDDEGDMPVVVSGL